MAAMSIMFTVQDMPTSLAFYRDTLGFEMKESWPDEAHPMWCNLLLEGQSVMLGSLPAEGDDMECAGHGGEPDAAEKWALGLYRAARSHPLGVGSFVYIEVADVDAFHAAVCARGAMPHYEPKTQFYAIRDFAIDDPNGYHLVFHTPVSMTSCQSCGMPLTEAVEGQMYCQHCTDDSGKLHSYEAIFEGTVTGYFMGMRSMSREDAEAAATEHLSKMPAWVARS